jgi:hypothetical protein
MYQVNSASVVSQIMQIWEYAIDGFAHFQERSDAKFETSWAAPRFLQM